MQLRTSLTLLALPLVLLSGCSTQPTTDSRPTAAAAVVSPQPELSRDPAIDAYVAKVRAELSTGKVNVINAVMQLTPEQASAFWPLYSEYEDELFALGDRRLSLIERFVTAQTKGTLSNDTAGSIATDWLKLQRDSADLMQTYYDQLSKEVSPLHAAQFLQIEHRMNTVIDLVVASEMPWVMQPGQSHTSP